MKKPLIVFLVFCLLTGGAAATAQTPPQLIDGADLLTISEEAALGSLLEEISKEVEAQIAVVTADTIDGRDIDGFINEFYDEKGYGYGTDRSGVLLLVCMDTREYHMLSNGEAGNAITEYEIAQIGDVIVSDLSEGNYADAFEAYAEECRYYIDLYQNESDGYPEEYPGDYREEYEESTAFDVQFSLTVSLIIGLVVGGIVILVLVGQLKSVRRQDQANAYIRPGSLQLTQSGDYFMYRNVTRTAKPQNNSSGGGGGSRMGGGGSRMGGGGSRHTGGGRF